MNFTYSTLGQAKSTADTSNVLPFVDSLHPLTFQYWLCVTFFYWGCTREYIFMFFTHFDTKKESVKQRQINTLQRITVNKTKSTPGWENLVSTVPHSLVLHYFIHCRQCPNTQADKGRKNLKKKNHELKVLYNFKWHWSNDHQSQGPRSLRHWSAAARLLRLWVRILLGGMDVCLRWVLCVVT